MPFCQVTPMIWSRQRVIPSPNWSAGSGVSASALPVARSSRAMREWPYCPVPS
jgi:hypothetical protein